jgi:hypothetical protein
LSIASNIINIVVLIIQRYSSLWWRYNQVLLYVLFPNLGYVLKIR